MQHAAISQSMCISLLLEASSFNSPGASPLGALTARMGKVTSPPFFTSQRVESVRSGPICSRCWLAASRPSRTPGSVRVRRCPDAALSFSAARRELCRRRDVNEGGEKGSGLTLTV